MYLEHMLNSCARLIAIPCKKKLKEQKHMRTSFFSFLHLRVRSYSLASRRRRKEKSKKLGLLKNGSRRIRSYFAHVKQNEASKRPRS